MHLNVSSWSSARPEQRIPFPALVARADEFPHTGFGVSPTGLSVKFRRGSPAVPQSPKPQVLSTRSLGPLIFVILSIKSIVRMWSERSTAHWRGVSSFSRPRRVGRVFAARKIHAAGSKLKPPSGRSWEEVRSRRTDGALATHTNLYLTFQHLMKTANQGASGRSTAPAMPIPSAALAASSPAAAMAASSTPPTDA